MRAEASASRVGPRGDGLALSLATGYQGLDRGGAVAYLLPRWGRFQVAPWLGLGVFTRPERDVVGLNAGLSTSLGWRHRATADLAGGTVRTEQLYLYGYEADARAVRGASVAAGYEFLGEGGFLFRFLLGTALRIEESANRMSRFSRTACLSVGWKLW